MGQAEFKLGEVVTAKDKALVRFLTKKNGKVSTTSRVVLVIMNDAVV